ncbi:trypsin-like serine peptidase [Planobispora longispora]|uniref:Serine protease n=1 Tax=Planobispora longispora TaxID=28887 RepID=A0A8J3W9B0_9ACTN|nr:hypothetical protein [Planobispora longispora]BFE83239.1 hypothetical protein GCM10020093_058400 [Planobispora longispora]GIH80612.1 hypothetical protein Plo01_70410 [Planobispora longispora]
MKRILIPAGGAIIATGLLAAGLAGTASADPRWEYDTMAKDAPAAVDVAEYWLGHNGEAQRLAAATAYNWETKPSSTLSVGGGYVADGKPGFAAPIGEEKKTTAKVKNINLPKTIGKVFFVDDNGNPRWCSATSIQAKYRNLVATAGHCVYDEAQNGSVMDNWIFVPGYYQGKAPYGVYVGKTAYTHYDFAVYEDRDRDYAFVTVYNGIRVGGGAPKVVTKDVFDKYDGLKGVKTTEISQAEYEKCRDFNGKETSDCYAKTSETQELVGPDHADAVQVKEEVSKEAYAAAPAGNVQGAKDYEVTENVTETEYKNYTGPGYRKIDANGNFTITHYYVKKFVKKSSTTKYLKDTFIIVEGWIRDAGRLGDVVGGQGFAWNQKTGQNVFVFGYPALTHPDGNKPYTGITPKWCYGKTSGKVYTNASYKIEEHVAIKCAMTQGADGAPWLIKYSNAKRLGYVNGVTSTFVDQDGNGRWDYNTSAYFDGETAAIYAKAANVWSGSIVK